MGWGVKSEGALGLDLGGVMWRNEGEYDKNTLHASLKCSKLNKNAILKKLGLGTKSERGLGKVTMERGLV